MNDEVGIDILPFKPGSMSNFAWSSVIRLLMRILPIKETVPVWGISSCLAVESLEIRVA